MENENAWEGPRALAVYHSNDAADDKGCLSRTTADAAGNAVGRSGRQSTRHSMWQNTERGGGMRQHA